MSHAVCSSPNVPCNHMPDSPAQGMEGYCARHPPMRGCHTSGGILTNLGRHQWGAGGWGQWLMSYLFFPLLKTPEQGASTSITAAVSPDLEEHSGALLGLLLDASCGHTLMLV